MKNIFGKKEDLKLYNKEGKIVYEYYITSDGYSYKYTYDSFGNVLTSENSDGYSYKYTRDSFGNPLTLEDSNGLSEKWARDSEGNELTYENSKGERRGFDIPEYTMDELIEILKERLGEFKVVVK